MYRGKVTAVTSAGIFVQTADFGTLGPCDWTGSPLAVGDYALIANVGDDTQPDLIVVGRTNKPGQVDQTKFSTSGPTQLIEVQGYNLRIKSNGSSDYFAVNYGGTFTFVGAVAFGSGGPTITSGTGAPSASQPDGSLYLRKDGGAGTTLYVREAGSWAAK